MPGFCRGKHFLGLSSKSDFCRQDCAWELFAEGSIEKLQMPYFDNLRFGLNKFVVQALNPSRLCVRAIG